MLIKYTTKKDLTGVWTGGYAGPALAEFSAGIETPFSTGAKAPTQAFFIVRFLVGCMERPSGRPFPVEGGFNSVQLTTLFRLKPESGGIFYLLLQEGIHYA